MTDYKLNIQFDSNGLRTLEAASQKVVIVKTTTPSTLPVAWVAFTPEETNTISWTEAYSVYGSTTQIGDGAIIETLSTNTANGGFTYTFSGGLFDDGQSNLPNNEYGIVNNDSDSQCKLLTAGLAQVANGGGSGGVLTPLNATVVPYNETGTYTPVEKVQVFTAANMSNGLVISEIQSNAIEVDLTETTELAIHYDDNENVFVLAWVSER